MALFSLFLTSIAILPQVLAYPDAPIKTWKDQNGRTVISYDAKFEDTNAGVLAGLPVRGITPLKAYDSLSYENMGVIKINNGVAVTGLAAQSPNNVLGYDVASSATSSPYITSIFVDTITDYFNFKSFYFGCVIDSQETQAGVPTSCSVALTGSKKGKVVGTQTASFTAKLPLSNMVAITLNSGFKNVDTVTFATNGGLAVSIAVLFDNLEYDAVLLPGH